VRFFLVEVVNGARAIPHVDKREDVFMGRPELMEPVGYILPGGVTLTSRSGIAYGMKAECCVFVEADALNGVFIGQRRQGKGAQRAGWPMQKNGTWF